MRSNGTDYEVLLTAKMTGEMKQGERTVPLAELMGQGRPASDLPGAVVLSVPQDSRINIHVGENTFNINSVAKPRTYPVPFHVDWHTQSYTIGVFTGVALFMALMFSVPPDPKSLSLDAFMNDQRLAKFLVKPEEQKPEEIPDWLKKAKQENENAGGKRAKETEGKMGKKDSSAKNKIFAIKGPPTNTDIKMAKEAAKDAAKNAGVPVSFARVWLVAWPPSSVVTRPSAATRKTPWVVSWVRKSAMPTAPVASASSAAAAVVVARVKARSALATSAPSVVARALLAVACTVPALVPSRLARPVLPKSCPVPLRSAARSIRN